MLRFKIATTVCFFVVSGVDVRGLNPLIPVPIPVPIVDPDVDPTDYQNPSDPSTWVGIPDNISDDEALAALTCINEAFTHESSEVEF